MTTMMTFIRYLNNLSPVTRRKKFERHRSPHATDKHRAPGTRRFTAGDYVRQWREGMGL